MGHSLSLTLNNSKGSIFCRLCFVGEKTMACLCSLLKVHVAKGRAEIQTHTVQTQANYS